MYERSGAHVAEGHVAERNRHEFMFARAASASAVGRPGRALTNPFVASQRANGLSESRFPGLPPLHCQIHLADEFDIIAVCEKFERMVKDKDVRNLWEQGSVAAGASIGWPLEHHFWNGCR